ncbi:MAG: HlyD family type I secretion periplasmic adaptor subunit [Pseudomonadota bacterium]
MSMQLQLPGPGGAPQQKDQWGARGYIRFGLFSVLVLVGGLGTWGATAELASAVVASGSLRVTAQQQVVQHPDGGVVGEIMVKDGDVVEGGAVLVSLDGTSLSAELAALEGQLFELMARRGRLMAEQAEADGILFDDELLAAAQFDPEVRILVDGQQSLFTARIQTMEREMSVMGERQGQIREQITGTEAELEALRQQLALIEAELEDARALLEKGLIQKSRVLSLQREAARLRGEVGQMIAQNAQLKGQISEIEIEQLRMMDTRREEAITQLREIGFRELELKQRRIQLKEQLDRLDIRAPRAGIVYDNQVHALKAVIRPADPIMYIVPTDTGLVIEARVDTIDIDSVWIGQETVLRLSALNTRTTPELFGTVTKISADSFVDDATGQQYYKVEVELREGELERLEGQELVAGMPVETHIQTGLRTPVEYITKPILDYVERAWKETD